MSKKPKKKGDPLKKKCDELWGLAIRKRDKDTCQACFRPGNNPHHIFGRRYLSTRHDLENGICLCWACHHHKAHGDPEMFRGLIIKRMGQKRFDVLTVKAYAVKTHDMAMRKIALKAYLNNN